ncbi:MAG: NAD+ synthase [Candidatus Nanoarchaeia archaeon]|jgi:NAD+ synthetase|nr:NAD+ synthase [Candidatus Nanoarchaeia archaeon]
MLINLCQIDTIVGDFKYNIDKIINVLVSNNASEKQIFVFPELTIPGYPLLDLVDNKVFVEEQQKAFDYFLQKTSDNESLIIVGYLEKNTGYGKSLYNSAAVCYKGTIIFNYRKRLLPTYDVFDEARYFEPGTEMGLFHYRGKRIGLTICEDLWYENKMYKINPAKELFNANAEILISINGSPSIVGKHKQKVDMIKNISKKYALPIVYVNQVGGNDDIIFDGNSFATNKKGNIVLSMNKFEEQICQIHSENLNYHSYGINPKGYTHKAFDSDRQFFYEQAVFGIRSYIEKCRFPGVVIGESGGIDSAVVTALAVKAIGAEKVIGITMPSCFSSTGSHEDSELLCKNLGVRIYKILIHKYYENLLLDFNKEFESKMRGVMEENLQARIRGMILMSYSNRYGHLVLSTGNKSELSVGYCTMYGDMCGGLSPISGLYKTEVFDVAKYINEINNKELIPQIIIDKEPSAELSFDQKDTDNLPPYHILDAILKLFIEGELLDINEKKQCIKTIRSSNENHVSKVLNLLKKAEFKRRQSPIGIKMHKKDFGYGRRIPIVQNNVFNIGDIYDVSL